MLGCASVCNPWSYPDNHTIRYCTDAHLHVACSLISSSRLPRPPRIGCVAPFGSVPRVLYWRYLCLDVWNPHLSTSLFSSPLNRVLVGGRPRPARCSVSIIDISSERSLLSIFVTLSLTLIYVVPPDNSLLMFEVTFLRLRTRYSRLVGGSALLREYASVFSRSQCSDQLNCCWRTSPLERDILVIRIVVCYALYVLSV